VHATVQVVRFRPQARELEIVNAGHPPAVLFTADAAGSEPKARPIRLPSAPLGLEAEPDLSRRVVSVPAPFSLVLYTDGLTEAKSSPSSPYYGLKRLVRAVGAKPIPHAAPGSLIEAVLHDWHGYIVNEPPKDDVCVIAIGSAA
jgi:serine phosphatase RsbU (regulator of sigma subunit)